MSDIDIERKGSSSWCVVWLLPKLSYSSLAATWTWNFNQMISSPTEYTEFIKFWLRRFTICWIINICRMVHDICIYHQSTLNQLQVLYMWWGIIDWLIAMSTTDLDRQIEQLRRCEYIKESEVKSLCTKARELLAAESNVQRVEAPITVWIGDDLNHWFYFSALWWHPWPILRLDRIV